MFDNIFYLKLDSINSSFSLFTALDVQRRDGEIEKVKIISRFHIFFFQLTCYPLSSLN